MYVILVSGKLFLLLQATLPIPPAYFGTEIYIIVQSHN